MMELGVARIAVTVAKDDDTKELSNQELSWMVPQQP